MRCASIYQYTGVFVRRLLSTFSDKTTRPRARKQFDYTFDLATASPPLRHLPFPGGRAVPPVYVCASLYRMCIRFLCVFAVCGLSFLRVRACAGETTALSVRIFSVANPTERKEKHKGVDTQHDVHRTYYTFNGCMRSRVSVFFCAFVVPRTTDD